MNCVWGDCEEILAKFQVPASILNRRVKSLLCSFSVA